MRGAWEIRTARRDRRCCELGWRCRAVIRRGERYLYGACPPEHDVNTTGRWLITTACLRCAEDHGLHTAATREAAEDPFR